MGRVMAHRAGLLGGFFRAGDDVLFFDRFNPKARRKIRQVGDDSSERSAGVNPCPTLANLAVEVGDHRNKKVRGIFAPVFFKQSHQLFVEEPNGALQKAQKIPAAESPPVLQKNVVLLLDANARQLPEHVEPVGEVLELYQTDLPIPRLLGNDGLQGNRCVSMSSSRVVVDDKDSLHTTDSAIADTGLSQSTLHAMWTIV